MGRVWVDTITAVVIGAINVRVPKTLKNRNMLEGFCGLTMLLASLWLPTYQLACEGFF